MDKNTVVGLLLILGLLVGYSYWVSPSKEELQERKRIQDSLSLVQSKQAIEKCCSNRRSQYKQYYFHNRHYHHPYFV